MLPCWLSVCSTNTQSCPRSNGLCCAPDPVAWLWTHIQEKVHRKGGVGVACKTVRQPKASSALWYTVCIAEQEARAAL